MIDGPATTASSRRPRPSPTAATRCPAPLYIYVNTCSGRREPRRRRLRRLLPQRRHRRVEEVGYVALPDDELDDDPETWDRPDHRHPQAGASPGRPADARHRPSVTVDRWHSGRGHRRARSPSTTSHGNPEAPTGATASSGRSCCGAAAGVDPHQRSHRAVAGHARRGRSSARSSGRACGATAGSPGAASTSLKPCWWAAFIVTGIAMLVATPARPRRRRSTWPSTPRPGCGGSSSPASRCWPASPAWSSASSPSR